jgi:Protein of unknown function (DUF3108)
MISKILKLFVMVLLLTVSNKTFSQSGVFSDGEELIYDVYYSFINIGWAKFNTTRVIGTKNRYMCQAVLKSNEALPFVTVDFNFTSEIEVLDNFVRPVKFISKEFRDGKVSIITYGFNYDSSSAYIKKIGFEGQTEYEERIPLYGVYQDGLSIFYFARFNFFSNKSVDVPVLINQDSSSIHINFNTAKTDIDIGEVNYDISSVYLDGSTNYKFVFGLTGDFSGWFTNDAARIPVKAKLKVKIGNVTLELKGWKRQGWNPPKY